MGQGLSRWQFGISQRSAAEEPQTVVNVMREIVRLLSLTPVTSTIGMPGIYRMGASLSGASGSGVDGCWGTTSTVTFRRAFEWLQPPRAQREIQLIFIRVRARRTH